MPISFEESAAFTADQARVEEVYKSIDHRLQDRVWMQDNVRYSETNPLYHFVGAGELTDKEKDMVRTAYLNVGWGEVIVRNSSENGEHGGLWSVILKRFVVLGTKA